jgi:hypothetical protein
MQRPFRNAALLGVFSVAALCGLSLTPGAADAQVRVERECQAEGPGDISMQADFERRGQRRKFSVEFEAAPNGAFTAGQRIVFAVAGQNVGVRRLETVVGGDLVADLNYDTQAGPTDPDEDPFPPNFPAIQRNTLVQVKAGGDVVLGCRLR